MGGVKTLPWAGQLCVTGTITQYHYGAQIVLHNAASWCVFKTHATPSPQLSKDLHYTNNEAAGFLFSKLTQRGSTQSDRCV